MCIHTALCIETTVGIAVVVQRIPMVLQCILLSYMFWILLNITQRIFILWTFFLLFGESNMSESTGRFMGEKKSVIPLSLFYSILTISFWGIFFFYFSLERPLRKGKAYQFISFRSNSIHVISNHLINMNKKKYIINMRFFLWVKRSANYFSFGTSA